MPKCAVWSCKNSSNNIRIRDGVSFFHYPRDPLLADQWWSVLGPSVGVSFKPNTAVVCSDHFHNNHKYMCKKRHRLTRDAVPDLQLLGPASVPHRPSTMLPQYDQFADVESSDDETNMIIDIPEILRPPSESTVCRVCLMTEGRMRRVTEDNYENAYKEVTGIKWNKEDKLPQHLCWECGHRLQAAARFKSKALAAHSLLQGISSDQSSITLNDIKRIDRNYNELASNLSEKLFPPNQYLSDTPVNNNKILSLPATESEKRLKINSDIKRSKKEFVPLVNLKTIAEITPLIKNDVKLDINPNKCSITVSYNNLNPTAEDLQNENSQPEDLSMATKIKLENIRKSLDAYKNLKPNGMDNGIATYKNIQSGTDTDYSNLNPKNGDSPAYKNLTNIDSMKVEDTYKNSKPTADASLLPSYLNITDTYYSNLNPKNGDSPTYKNLGTDIDKMKVEDTCKHSAPTADASLLPSYLNITDTYYRNLNPKNGDSQSYKNIGTDIDDIKVEDTYKNSKPTADASLLPSYLNITDTYYSNLNPKNGDLPTYKNLGTDIDNIKVEDTYKNSKPTADASLPPSYLKPNSDTLKNSHDNTTYKNLDDIKNLVPTYKNLESRDMPKLNVTESETDLAPKRNDSFVKCDDNYDSDESDKIVIDANRSDTLETVIKSEYVGVRDGGMPIDELIDIYNNDGDGDGRLQELNDRFGDEATVKVEQGWGTRRRADIGSHRGQNRKKAVAERTKPGTVKSSDVLTGNGIHSRAYEKLSQTLFTLTPVSEAEQIADISKRQDTFRFKRAPFKCYLCFRCFQARQAYDKHMLRHDASKGAFECTVCRSRQKSPRAVRTHMHGQHTVRISCNDCNFVTMNRSVARSHEKWHAGNTYRCSYCSIQFGQEASYKNHMRARHVQAFACSICGLAFVSRKGLAVHRCKRHVNADQIPLLGPYCAACETRFLSDEVYAKHLKQSSKHRPESSQSTVGIRDAGN